MVKPAVCNYPKKRYCYNFCCYIVDKRVRPKEIEQLGLEHILQKGKKYYLKSKNHPTYGHCVFLDEEERKCSIYSKRPHCCKSYDCVGGPNPRNEIEEARHSRKTRGYEV